MLLSHALLTRDEEKRLLALTRKGSKDAENRLVEMNQRLVYDWALRFYNVGGGGDQTLDDLVQWGNIGLLRAIRKYEPDKGVVLSTYASWWIRSSIRRFGVIRGIHFSVSYKFIERLHTVRLSREFNEGKEEITQIAHRTNLNRQVVEDALAIMAPVDSLDRNADETGTTTLGELIRDPSADTEEDALRRALVHQLMHFINKLPANLATILKHRYQLNDAQFLTYVELGRRLGISRGRVQQLEKIALTLLREEFASIG